jgi:hypothetical protein
LCPRFALFWLTWVCQVRPSVGLSQVKSRYSHSAVNPNQITQSLIAVLAGLRVPFICTESHEMGEEILASYLYHVHLYHWLERTDLALL